MVWLENDVESRKLYLNMGNSEVGFYTYSSDPIETVWYCRGGDNQGSKALEKVM